jgi:hypothetical protein
MLEGEDERQEEEDDTTRRKHPVNIELELVEEP